MTLNQNEIVRIPLRPWGFEVLEGYICVGSIRDDGSMNETVFTIELEGEHLPTELARVQLIVDAVNSFRPYPGRLQP